MDRDGIKLLMERIREPSTVLPHLWLEAGYNGKGKDWVEKDLGLTAQVGRRPRRPPYVRVSRRGEDRLRESREALAQAGLQDPASQVGGGADVLVVRPEQADEQGLRAFVRDERGVHLLGDGTPDGEKIGSFMRLLRLSLLLDV